jgi:hypothetical protein
VQLLGRADNVELKVPQREVQLNRARANLVTNGDGVNDLAGILARRDYVVELSVDALGLYVFEACIGKSGGIDAIAPRALSTVKPFGIRCGRWIAAVYSHRVPAGRWTADSLRPTARIAP